MDAPEVREAFLGGGPVALAVFEWSGKWQQDWLLGWTMIDGAAAIDTAIARIAGSVRVETRYPTALGYALGYGANAFREAPACTYRTMDVSGDGVNNDGFPPAAAYREFPFDGVTVNGLVVNAADFEGEVGLIAFYRGEVLHGPGAFMVIADSFADYARAMRAKLVREVSPTAIGALE